jgi:hypothetical protein
MLSVWVATGLLAISSAQAGAVEPSPPSPGAAQRLIRAADQALIQAETSGDPAPLTTGAADPYLSGAKTLVAAAKICGLAFVRPKVVAPYASSQVVSLGKNAFLVKGTLVAKNKADAKTLAQGNISAFGTAKASRYTVFVRDSQRSPWRIQLDFGGLDEALGSQVALGKRSGVVKSAQQAVSDFTQFLDAIPNDATPTTYAAMSTEFVGAGHQLTDAVKSSVPKSETSTNSGSTIVNNDSTPAYAVSINGGGELVLGSYTVDLTFAGTNGIVVTAPTAQSCATGLSNPLTVSGTYSSSDETVAVNLAVRIPPPTGSKARNAAQKLTVIGEQDLPVSFKGNP